MSTSAIGLSTVNGLPAHVLIVHLVVVAVPLAAVFLLASLHPRFAGRLGIALPVTATIALASVLAAMNAGGWLQNHVENSPDVRHHAELGGQLWPFSVAVLLLSLVVWWFRRVEVGATDDGGGGRERHAAGVVAIGALSLIVAVLSVVQVVRIGDSGSRSAWHDHFSKTAVSHAEH